MVHSSWLSRLLTRCACPANAGTTSVRDQGKVDGLFRSCMDSIRMSHGVGQALRTAMLGAGLMTDKCVVAC